MRRSRLLRGAAVAAALALALTACGDGDDDTEAEDVVEEEAPEEEEPEEPEEEPEEDVDLDIDRPGRDDVLDLGYILPESGPLASLGPPQIVGVQMAVEEINEAGGVNGSDVTLQPGDEAGDAAIAQQNTAQLINAGVDAVIGAAASGMSQEIIQLLYDNQIVQCSASNTSPAFSDQSENNGFYHRTVPPDEAVTPVIVDELLNDGHQNVAVVARADDYGVALGDLVSDGVEAAGGTIVSRTDYDPNTTDFSAEVSEVTGASPDAVVVVAFDEGATFIRQVIEAGISPDQLYGGDGIFGPGLVGNVNPDDESFIAGMKVIGAAGGEDFNERLEEALPDSETGNYIYGGQGYDCAIIIALAAIAADSTDPAVFNDHIADVTRDGTTCTSFEECAQLLEDGEDIDYDGASGPLALEGTDPTFGRYAIAQYQEDGTLQIVGDQDIDLAELN